MKQHSKLMSKSEFEAHVARLKERYAYQFQGPNAGHYIEPGWLGLVTRLCEAVDEALTPAMCKDFHWSQIKEKFGTLRVYWQDGPVSIDFFGEDGHARIEAETKADTGIDQATSGRLQALVHEAEVQSAKTCLFCGAAGTLRRGRGWIVTACDGCDRSRRTFSDEDES